MNNRKGFSMVQALVALGILFMVFGVIFQFGKINSQRIQTEGESTCRQIARSSLDNIRSIGFEDSMATVSLPDNQISYPANVRASGVSKNDISPLGAGSKPLTEQPTAGSNTFVSNSYMTVVGSMSALAGIYSQNARNTYCRASQGAYYKSSASGAPDLLVQYDVPGRMTDVNTTLKIERYNLQQGTRDCDAFYPLPLGKVSSDVVTNQRILQYPPEVSSSYGFWVTVFVNYKDSNGQSNNCEASSLFQYPRKETTSSLAMTVSVSFSGLTSHPACAPSMPEGQVVVNLPPPDAGSSRTPMCRDLSIINSSYGSDGACYGRVAAGSIPANDKWVPCQEVTLCGQAPLPSSPGFSADGKNISLRYSNIPMGCMGRIESKLIDETLNIVANDTSMVVDLGTPPCRTCPAGWRGVSCDPPGGCDKDEGGTEGPGGGDGGSGGGGNRDGGDASGGDGDGTDGGAG